MQVRLLTNIVGPGCVYRVGEVHDLPAREAKARIESGEAEPVAKKAVERAERR